jgi:glutamyl-tRNA reductase
MPLQRGEVRGYDFNRMTVDFTMLNQGKVVLCSVSTAAMDDLEGSRDVKSDQRIDQFMRLREIIEERASRKFFEEQAQADRPVVLRKVNHRAATVARACFESEHSGNRRPEPRGLS